MAHKKISRSLALNAFAVNVFRRQADFDYIAARALYRMQLRQQFLWSAMHCVEKYLKAILLFNGRSARHIDASADPGVPVPPKTEYRHDLGMLYRQICGIEDIPMQLQTEDNDFMHRLSCGGNDRYITTAATSHFDDLHKLDRLVWLVRRFCQGFPSETRMLNGTTVNIRRQMIQEAGHARWLNKPKDFQLSGGELEKVLRKPSADLARQVLVWSNAHYGNEVTDDPMLGMFSSTEIPPNERDWYQQVDHADIKKFVKL